MAGMGTTPPSCENTGDHPAGLLSQRSYPGASQTTQTTTTTSNTVPPSPTTAQVLKKYRFIICLLAGSLFPLSCSFFIEPQT